MLECHIRTITFVYITVGKPFGLYYITHGFKDFGILGMTGRCGIHHIGQAPVIIMLGIVGRKFLALYVHGIFFRSFAYPFGSQFHTIGNDIPETLTHGQPFDHRHH